jgi:hypothetical protein
MISITDTITITIITVAIITVAIITITIITITIITISPSPNVDTYSHNLWEAGSIFCWTI